jgi:membrane protein DedA with SNARE-associated domain
MDWLPRLLIMLGRPAQTLAALISLQTLQEALHIWGYPAVTLFVMVESSGIPFPGETMLLLASFAAAIDQRLQIPLVIACAALGAILGDNIGYAVGRRGGRPLVERFGRYVLLKPEHLDRAEQFFARHGDKTVFFGRFIAVLRAWAAFLAGVNRMPWRTFLVYNAAGGIVWATIFGLLGYFAGRVFHDNFARVEQLARTISWTGALLLVLAVVLAFVVFRLRRARLMRRKALEAIRITRQETSVEGVPAVPTVPAGGRSADQAKDADRLQSEAESFPAEVPPAGSIAADEKPPVAGEERAPPGGQTDERPLHGPDA